MKAQDLHDLWHGAEQRAQAEMTLRLEAERRLEEANSEIERLKKFHAEDIRVTNDSADYHIKECNAIRQQLETEKALHMQTIEGVEAAVERQRQEKLEVLANLQTEKAARAEAEKQTKLHCQDWADAHTYCQTVAKRLGVPESQVDGDKHGVPTIEDLIGMVVAHQQQRILALECTLGQIAKWCAPVGFAEDTKQQVKKMAEEALSQTPNAALGGKEEKS